VSDLYRLRLEFDGKRNREVKKKPGIGLDEVREIFEQAYAFDRKSNDPEQYRAVGWCGVQPCSVIFEIRRDEEGDSYLRKTAWRAMKQEQQLYAEPV
jgi:uncharacterized DUF497 family protein